MDLLKKLEIIAALFSLICVYLAAKNHILNWPVAIIASLLYAFVFFQNRFYSESLLQIVFMLFQLYGWWFWSPFNPNKKESHIKHIPKKYVLPTIWVFLIVYFIWLQGYLKFFTNAQQPYLDTFLSILSITALWMQANRWIAHWYLWIVADILYVPMFFFGGNQITALLYLVFIGLAIHGLLSWAQKLKTPLQ